MPKSAGQPGSGGKGPQTPASTQWAKGIKSPGTHTGPSTPGTAGVNVIVGKRTVEGRGAPGKPS